MERQSLVRSFAVAVCRRVVAATVAFGLLALPIVGLAQEAKKEWRISEPDDQSAVYNTQQQAVDAIKTLPMDPAEFQFLWEYVNQIKSSSISEDGTLSITYWMGKNETLDPDWSYGGPYTAEKFTSEDAIRANFIEHLNARNTACPASATAVSLGEWVPAVPGYEGRIESRMYSYTWMVGSNTPDSPCQSTSPQQDQFLRQRRLECSNPYTDWSDDYQACVNEDLVAVISSKTDECDKDGASSECKDEFTDEDDQGGCDGNVGNPCNVKTGEKYETELDFDLGWISLSRHYHSGVSTVSGGFGHGWTHSLDTRLVFGGPDVVGLIEGTGYQRPFKELGSVFEAIDGSGDRLLSSGGDWTLYTGSDTLIFNSAGRVQLRRRPDGTSLAYTYDTNGRLSAVSHSSGRTLTFAYQSNASDALIGSVTLDGVALATYTYTTQGQVSTATYPGAGTRTYHYEDSRFPHHLTGITAEDTLRYSTFTYDAQGRVISSQHEGGADGVTLSYSSTGTVVTDALGHVTTYALTAGGATDPARKVSDLTDPRGTVSRTYYAPSIDFRRRLDTLTDRNGTQTKHAYSEVTDTVTGQLASVHTIKEAVGLTEERTREVRRDLATNRLLLTKLGNLETRYARNSRLQPVTITATDLTTGKTRTSQFTYCEAADVAASGGTCPIEGLVKSVNGPRTDVADTTTFTYYGSDHAACATTPASCTYRKGDLWKVTNALGHVTETLAYDAAGRPLTIKDANGVVTDLEYYPRGWLKARKVRGTSASTESDDRITRFDYWPTGLVKKVTQPDGVFLTFTYDAAQRLKTITDSAGNSVSYALDNAGNRLQEDTKDSGGALKRTLSRVFNTLGQQATLADANVNPTDYTYDVDGNLDTITDAANRVADRDYDPLGRLKRTLLDMGGIDAATQFEYNAVDAVTKITDPKGLDTTYTYNGFGDLTQLSSPDTGTTKYTYDSAGNRETRTDARGVTTAYSYDALSRLAAVSYSDGTPGVTYAYDVASSSTSCQPVGASSSFAKGRLTRMADSTGTTDYCYNRFGDTVGKVQKGLQTLSVAYNYAVSGRLNSIVYPGYNLAEYLYNSLGQVTTIRTTAPGGSTEIVLKDATYAPYGPVTGWTWGNGRTLLRPVDQDYRTTSIHDGSAGGLSVSYRHDSVGNIDQIWNAAQTVQHASYEYDNLNRLTVTNGPTGLPVESYTYDATGDRTSLTNGVGSQSYSYPATNHRLSSIAGSARTYDQAGNLETIAATDRRFAYDGAGRMMQARERGTGAIRMNYRYNGKGERTQQFLGDPATTSTYTVYDEQGRWLGDYDANGVAKQQIIWLGDLPVALLSGSFSAQALHYIEADNLGTPRVVVEPVRNVAVWNWDIKSEAFGNSPPQQDPDGDGIPLVLDLRFPGQRYDSATGLNYNYFRDYDPVVGRYVQSDPIGLKGGISTYGYVSGNPLSLRDPLGLCECNLPLSSTFFQNYPNYKDYSASRVWSTIGGSIGKKYGSGSNSCAARVSYGLNASGSPISAAKGTNRNYGGTPGRYILSASDMRSYLRSTYGNPSSTLRTYEDLTKLYYNLKPGEVAIIASDSHIAVFKQGYYDDYVAYYLGDVWRLPTSPCQCEK